MDNKFISIVKSFSYAISSNLISMLISALVTLIVPKVIGVEDYGYWQIYLFYASYVGFLHFGWNDGVYLKYGGMKYKELNKKPLFSQFWTLSVFQLFIAILAIIGISSAFSSENEIFVFSMIALNVLFVNTRIFLIYILQATGRIKDYSKTTIVDRIIYFILISGLILLGVKSFYLLVFADLVGKCISLIYTMVMCKDIVFRRISEFYIDIKEIVANISSGSKLMFANIASSLILGTVKFGIERSWSVATFGKVSLTLSVSNLLMKFIIAISLVIYPILRNARKEQLSSIYMGIRNILMLVLLGSLTFYYPINFLLSIWLPEYAESLEYMALVFPIIIFEGKVGLLTNTYLKTLREEKLLLKINVITVILSVISTIVTTVLLENLVLAMISIVILLALKSIIAEKYLSGILSIDVWYDIVLELIMTFIFIFVAWNINAWFGMLIYLTVYILYIGIKFNDFRDTFRFMKALIVK
ncbi:hypothetical protein SAMN04488506_1204 [Desemzia incerta]|uniref:Membrane protein involved in the export of O-antigen and teichoic acid n=1 Tax=Desemzia incerta TaxID=82801 RepID=A0A1I5X5I8_9LACT|nr:hypothetical protein [Desemzia incerta]SFQ27259.1 hypothetical protein SAMN04488506_1204 [Desemzia incerta]